MKKIILVLALMGVNAMANQPMMRFKAGSSKATTNNTVATTTESTSATEFARPAAVNTSLSLAYFQPEKGVISGTVTPQYATTTSSGTNAFAKYDAKTIATQIRMQYGINPNAAIKLETSFGQQDQNFTGNFESHNKGLSDLVFGYSNKSARDSGQLLTGADLSLSLEAGSINIAKGKDGNRFSGGTTITPYIGFETARPNGQVVGMVGSLAINQDKRVDLISVNNDKSETVLSGGNTLSLKGYTEWKSGSIMAGLLGNVSQIAGKSYVRGDGARIDFDSQTMLSVSAYGRSLTAGQKLQWIPQLTYTTNLNKNSGNTLASYDDLNLALSARF